MALKRREPRRLDSLWSKIVRLRAGMKCEYCGAEGPLNAHHIFSRRNQSTRLDLNNGICLCFEHHTEGNFSAHKSPGEFATWIRRTRGEEWYDNLMKKSYSIYKYIDYKAIGLFLNSEIKKYGSSSKAV